MDLNAVLAEARECIRQGEPGNAIEVLSTYFRGQGASYKSIGRTIDLISAAYQQTRTAELRGTLSAEAARLDYNRTNDTLLGLIEQLESGTAFLEHTVNKPRKAVWLVGGGLIAVLLAVAGWLLLRKPEYYPAWEGDNFRILVLPFNNLSSDNSATNPAIELCDKIEELAGKKNNIPVDVHPLDHLPKWASAGISKSIAEKLGKECDADLVLWGRFFTPSNSDSIRITTGFVFIPSGEGKIGKFSSFRDITEVSPDQDLNDAVLSICARIAAKTGHNEVMHKWLAKIRNRDEEETRAMVQ